MGVLWQIVVKSLLIEQAVKSKLLTYRDGTLFNNQGLEWARVSFNDHDLALHSLTSIRHLHLIDSDARSNATFIGDQVSSRLVRRTHKNLTELRQSKAQIRQFTAQFRFLASGARAAWGSKPGFWLVVC